MCLEGQTILCLLYMLRERENLRLIGLAREIYERDPRFCSGLSRGKRMPSVANVNL